MEIVIKCPQNTATTGIRLSETTNKSNGEIERLAIKTHDHRTLVSIKKEHGYLMVKIDEKEIETIKKDNIQ